MKNLIVFLIVIISSLSAYAQENVKVCDENQASFKQYIQDNKFDEAQQLINIILKNCPSANEKLYLNAEKLYLHNLEFAVSDSEKSSSIKDLIKLYDLYDKKFPENSNRNATKKAIYLYDNNIGTKNEVYKILDNLFKTRPKNFINPRAFYIYFELFEKKSHEPNSDIKLDDLISKNIEINNKNNVLQFALNSEIENLNNKKKSGILTSAENSILISKNADLQAYKTIENATNGILQKYLNCDNLSTYTKKYLDQNKTNDFWLKYITKTLFDKNCYSSDNFLKIAQLSNDFNATSKSNYYLGYASILKGDTAKTINFFDESANKEPDIREKANIYYTIATTVYGINDKENSSKYLKKAIVTDANFGNPYLYLSQLYLSSIDECAKTDFEKKAIYWLIATTTEKAGLAEEYLKKATQKQIADYLKKTPTKTEIANSGKAGKTVTFDCFINETINIPIK